MITCPTCHKPHQEYWWVTGTGKRVLSYDCNRQIREVPQADASLDVRYSTKRMEVDADWIRANKKLGVGVEERWSKAWAKKQQEAAQTVMPEQVEGKDWTELQNLDWDINEAIKRKADLETQRMEINNKIRSQEQILADLGKRRSEITTIALL